MKNILKVDLQLFADFEEVFENNKEQLGELANNKEQFTSIKEKLGELGYDVLLNQKEKAEFVPSSRLNDVIGQRDNFKTKVEELNTQLEGLKNNSKGNEELQGKLQEMMDKNDTLLQDLETTRINSEIMVNATDAINPKDVLAFIDSSNIKSNSKGEVLGVESELNRLRTEKPYLFRGENNRKKAGMDNQSGTKDDDQIKVNMNSMIRKMAGR